MNYYKGKLSLSEEVYNGILEQIEKEELKVGEKLPSESKLCTMFGVSRTSVRAALQNLQGSNIIITVQGVGSFVHKKPSTESVAETINYEKPSDISSEKFKEFFEFRQAIEFKAIEFFIRRATKEDELQLKRFVEQLKIAGKNKDIASFTRIDYEFHMTIIEAAKNVFLYEAMKNYKDVFYHYMEEIIRLTDKPLMVLAQEHEELLTYLVEKKAKAAKDLLFADNTYYHVAYFNK